MISATISDSRYLIAEKFYYEYAFPGLLEGLPTKQMVKERLAEVRRLPVGKGLGLLGKLKSRFCDEEYFFYEQSFHKDPFPAYFCIADFQSTESTDGKSMLSYLTVAWFMPLEKGQGINEATSIALKYFDWVSHAKNGNY